MTKAELVDEIARKATLTRKHSEVIVDAVFSSIIEALQTGDKIELRGFENFRIQHRANRTRHNPKTGEGVQLAPRRHRQRSVKSVANTGLSTQSRASSPSRPRESVTRKRLSRSAVVADEFSGSPLRSVSSREMSVWRTWACRWLPGEKL